MRLKSRSRLTGPTRLAAAVAAAALVCPLTPAAVAAAPDIASVVPSALPEGEAVRVPALEIRANGELLLPGKDPISLEPLGAHPTQVCEADGGYLVTLTNYRQEGPAYIDEGQRIGFVAPDGTMKVIVPTTQYRLSAVASDGRTFVGMRTTHPQRSGDQARWSIRRFRVSDGQVLASSRPRPYSYPTPNVLAASPRDVLLRWPAPGGPTVRIASLHLSRDTIRVLAADRSRSGFRAAAPSLRAGAVAVPRGRYQRVVDAKTGRLLWRTEVGERTLLASPNGRNMLTAARRGSYQETATYTRSLTVRSARTGKVLASFAGFFNADGNPPWIGATWETNNSFVTYAYDDVTRENEGQTVGGAWIRCRISTNACERVPELGDDAAFGPGVYLLVRPSS